MRGRRSRGKDAPQSRPVDLGAAPVLAPFNPTSDEGIAAALDLLAVGSDDTVADLGCGDGRFLVAAAARGVRGLGVEADPIFAARARENVAAAGQADRVEVVEGDALTADLARVTALFVYLVPEGLALLRPVLDAVRARGVPIATYTFSISGWTPTEVRVVHPGESFDVSVYLYR